jgi:hypothetical protein
VGSGEQQQRQATDAKVRLSERADFFASRNFYVADFMGFAAISIRSGLRVAASALNASARRGGSGERP